MEGEAYYTNFVNELNQRIESHGNTLSIRKGSNKKQREKPLVILTLILSCSASYARINKALDSLINAHKKIVIAKPCSWFFRIIPIKLIRSPRIDRIKKISEEVEMKFPGLYTINEDKIRCLAKEITAEIK